MKLDILDYAPIDEGKTAVEAVRESTELARAAEELGYHRFWVAEHHGIKALASVSPEVLIANHAAVTRDIHVGSGGVMIPHYAAMKVAENFRQLAALHPGRIDLGIGRAPGADRRVSQALNDEKSGMIPFEQKMDSLLGFFTGEHGADSPYVGVETGPVTAEAPTPFILGAGGSTAPYAAHQGIGFTFAHFINGSGAGVTAVKAYREMFRPSRFLSRPRAIVAVFIAVGDTPREAEDFAATFHLWLAHAESMTPFTTLPTLEYTRDHQITREEKLVRQRNRHRLVSGTPDQVAEQLKELGATYGADEIMVNPLAPDAANRLKMITSLADAFGTTDRRTDVA